jgi:hypothetical protein
MKDARAFFFVASLVLTNDECELEVCMARLSQG